MVCSVYAQRRCGRGPRGKAENEQRDDGHEMGEHGKRDAKGAHNLLCCRVNVSCRSRFGRSILESPSTPANEWTSDFGLTGFITSSSRRQYQSTPPYYGRSTGNPPLPPGAAAGARALYCALGGLSLFSFNRPNRQSTQRACLKSRHRCFNASSMLFCNIHIMVVYT